MRKGLDFIQEQPYLRSIPADLLSPNMDHDRERHRSMSLVPYIPAESREIVLYVPKLRSCPKLALRLR